MLESASRGRLSIHHADIMKFYIPDAFPKADMVKWESNGTLTFCYIDVHVNCLNKFRVSSSFACMSKLHPICNRSPKGMTVLDGL